VWAWEGNPNGWDAGEVWGELHLPLYLGGVEVIFGDHQLMGMGRGSCWSKFFEPTPQYGSWIGDMGAAGEALRASAAVSQCMRESQPRELPNESVLALNLAMWDPCAKKYR
jgi:hypothetical protein